MIIYGICCYHNTPSTINKSRIEIKSLIKAGTDYRTCSVAQPLQQPRTWCLRVWEKMLVAQTATVAGPNQHSAARNAFVFVLKTDNFWFVQQQYSSALEHNHSMFATCLLIVHTIEHHVLGCRIRLCRGIRSIICTGLKSYTKRHVSKVIMKIISVSSQGFIKQSAPST